MKHSTLAIGDRMGLPSGQDRESMTKDCDQSSSFLPVYDGRDQTVFRLTFDSQHAGGSVKLNHCFRVITIVDLKNDVMRKRIQSIGLVSGCRSCEFESGHPAVLNSSFNNLTILRRPEFVIHEPSHGHPGFIIHKSGHPAVLNSSFMNLAMAILPFWIHHSPIWPSFRSEFVIHEPSHGHPAVLDSSFTNLAILPF
ncbi:unnamed protein product [Cyprideis torosa]|uniref:Uncharacterized protein n=1 Tax=Cyprideis torosa TaxID=163714 RepID=A0A7R8W1T3_9CRUS|nr:unnamed protein product [Cyprideis torosa]CAG0881102.1 unnamed protein product [Cyprideis torosa]